MAKATTKSHDRAITLCCIAGVLISTYGLYVELVKEAHPEYRALCDIGEHASCSKVLTSKYSKGFGIISKDSTLHLPNCVYGVLFYCLVIFLKILPPRYFCSEVEVMYIVDGIFECN